jgi:hypothetical protein
MPCPICDQKPMNCDCTEAERQMYAETEDLREQVPQWISVNERLPEEGERVLYYNGDCQQDYGRMVRIGRCIDDGPTGTRVLRIADMDLMSLTPNRDETWPSVTPTHWMPLPPEPPAP